MLQGPLGELTKVVLGKEDISVDKHILDKIEESAVLFASSPAYVPNEQTRAPVLSAGEGSADAVYFSYEFCRAAIYGCVTSLLQGRTGVKSSVVQFLLDMLEYEVIPCFTSVNNIGKDLVLFISGVSVPCYYYKQILESDAAFLSSGITKVQLNMHDFKTLETGHFYFTGIAGLLAVAGTSVFQMTDVVASMAVEASCTSADAFDVAQYETFRPHRGMINTAALIHQLLDGSQRTGSSDRPVNSSFMSIPAVHGPAADYIASATKSIILELQSSDATLDPRWVNTPEHSDPAYKQHKHHSHHKGERQGSAPSVHARIAVDLLAMATRTVLSASISRAAVLCDLHVQPAANAVATTTSDATPPRKVSSEAKELLSELIDMHNKESGPANDDDTRLNELFSSLSMLSKALSIELRISFEVVSDGMPQKSYDKGSPDMLVNQNDDQIMKVLNGLLRSDRRKVEGCPVGGDAEGCPMGMDALAISTSPGESAKCPVAHGTAKVEPGALCPVSGAKSVTTESETADLPTPPTVAATVAVEVKKEKGGKREAIDLDESLTPEQRAKIEAKRRAKEEKAAQKALSKAAKKGGNTAWKSLGNGTSLVRMHLASQLSLLPTFSFRNSVAMLQGYMHPYNVGEDGFAHVCNIVIQHIQSSGGRTRPKVAKGARDFGPDEMRIREKAFVTIRNVFKRHGAVEIDTPVFETKELLTGKYGEDSKLIYDLADQGGELLSLRYDLTVPFARFLAMNSVGNIKRFHIAKVYRRDNPNISKGRYREFYQCDFDIAGTFPTMVADAEVLAVAVEILSELPIGNFLVKLNHRKLLDGIFEICGVPSEKFRPICSAVDKLDKTPWELVKKEMVEEKGLDAAVADKIGEFVLYNGPPMELWNRLNDLKPFGDHTGALQGMAELQTLFGYLEALGCVQYFSFDLSLARGLDYYTGVIYEAVLTDGVSQVGSIAAGGRYDDLVGMFSVSGQKIPCVGVSIGVERVFAIMEKRAADEGKLAECNVQVYISSIGANMMKDRMRVAKMLWSANIASEYSHHENPKFKRQLEEALAKGVPVMLVFGEDEIQNGTIKVKDMIQHTECDIPLDTLVEYLKSNNLA